MATLREPEPEPRPEPRPEPGHDPEHVDDAVARARTLQPEWAARDVRERATALASLRRTIVREADHIVDVVRSETGKPAADVVMAEVMHAAAHAGWLATAAPGVLRPQRVSPRPAYTKRAWLRYRPKGVAAVIAPWNYPFLLPFLPTATALAAGCAVVLKPSELTPRSGGLVAELAEAAGLPASLVQVVQGGADTGAALARADVDVVSVTGSTRTGHAVAAAAAERLVPVIAELGGKDPLLVLDDADVRRAARATVWGACFNAGQSCVSVERVYVDIRVYDAFVAQLERALDDVTAAGDPRRDIGPLISPRQVDVVLDQIADAVGKGAIVRRGGRRYDVAGRSYVEPTLLTDVDHSMEVMREETFGPLLPVMAVGGDDDAVRAANDSEFALAASVWTADARRGRDVATRLRAGAVAVNDVAVNYGIPGLPFGGSGASGYGRQGGVEGLLAFCTSQTITDSRLLPPREIQWFPRLVGARGWKRAARLLYGR